MPGVDHGGRRVSLPDARRKLLLLADLLRQFGVAFGDDVSDGINDVGVEVDDGPEAALQSSCNTVHFTRNHPSGRRILSPAEFSDGTICE
jgi:hypothetical protein